MSGGKKLEFISMFGDSRAEHCAVGALSEPSLNACSINGHNHPAEEYKVGLENGSAQVLSFWLPIAAAVVDSGIGAGFLRVLPFTFSLIHSTDWSTINKTKQTPWPLVRERTIPTDRPPLVDEI
jgi:hypothetical protein